MTAAARLCCATGEVRMLGEDRRQVGDGLVLVSRTGCGGAKRAISWAKVLSKAATR